MKDKMILKDFAISLLVIFGMLVVSIISYIIAYYFSYELDIREANSNAAFVCSFIFQIAVILVCVTSK